MKQFRSPVFCIRLRLRIQPITPITCKAIIFAGDIESRRGSPTHPAPRSSQGMREEEPRASCWQKVQVCSFFISREERGDIFLAPLLFGVQLRRRFTKSLSRRCGDKNAVEQQQQQQAAQYIIDDYLMRARLQSVSATQQHICVRAE